MEGGDIVRNIWLSFLNNLRPKFWNERLRPQNKSRFLDTLELGRGKDRGPDKYILLSFKHFTVIHKQSIYIPLLVLMMSSRKLYIL